MSSVEALKNALQTLEAPAKGPKPNDIYKAHYWEMAGAHACILNGLLSVYEQAATVPEDRVYDFVGYALQWAAVIEHHHVWEETIYYPMYNPKFDTSFIVAEHETFTKGVEAFEEYLICCLPAGVTYGYGKVAGAHEQQKYDGVHLRSLADAFVTELTAHLLQEITYIEPDKIRASGLTEAEMKNISAVSDKHMMSMPPTTFLMYTLLLTPKSSGFPPVPGFIKNILGPYVFHIPNRKYWQFAPKK